MADRYDLVVANARLRGRGDIVHHIGIRSGRIAAIEPSPLRGDAELDAAGNLRVWDLLEAGVPVALGQDDIADAYYAFGQHNLLEVVFLAAHILGRSTTRELDVLLDMITTRAARVLRITDYGLEVGRAAHLVALEGSTVLDVITPHRPPRYVISHGRLVAQTTGTTTFHAIPTP